MDPVRLHWELTAGFQGVDMPWEGSKEGREIRLFV